MKDYLVIYHANCTDGSASAFVAHQKLGESADYLAMSYGDALDLKALEEAVRGRQVYMMDFSLPPKQIEIIKAHAKKFVWLDHHLSALKEHYPAEFEASGQELLGIEVKREDTLYIKFDMNKSGARLAFEYFYPDQPVPRFILDIDDRDRWQFKRESSALFHEASNCCGARNDFKLFGRYLDSQTYERALHEGKVLLQKKEQDVADDCKFPMRCFIGGREGLALNARNNISEIGNVLAKKSGAYALVWRLDEVGKINCSLRSIGAFDVSAMAKEFGGGGHRNAAGCQVPVELLLEWLK